MAPEQKTRTQRGHAVTIGGDADIRQIGDTYSYHQHIARANLILPPEFIRLFQAAYERDEHEDFSVAALPREEWEPETLFIPGGPFLMGSQPGEGIPVSETPQFDYSLPDYRIGKYPITNRQYSYYVNATSSAVPSELGWENGNQPSARQMKLPVRGVTWKEAIDYCNWLIEKTGRPYALPSEAQWEKAARGTTGSLFPWGDDWRDGQLCNISVEEVTAVDAFEAEENHFDCQDMVGNIREWTTSLWGRNRRYNLDRLSKYPWKERWKPNAGHDELSQNRQIRRVTRGGASLVPETMLRAARQESELPFMRGLKNRRIGFRVVLNWEATK